MVRQRLSLRSASRSEIGAEEIEREGGDEEVQAESSRGRRQEVQDRDRDRDRERGQDDNDDNEDDDDLPAEGEIAGSLTQLLKSLERSASYPLTKEKREVIGRTFGAINARVSKAGCTPEEINDGVALSLSGSISKQYSNKLFTFLHPISTVDERSIVYILGSLGADNHKLADTSTQAAALKWLVAIFEWLDTTARRTLGRMYSVLWCHLGIETLRPHLPYLLSLLTRREHVRPFRVRTILSLQARFPLDPSLPGLINVFRSYLPTRIPPGIGRAAGKRPYKVNATWKQKSRAIREGRVEEYEEELAQKRQERADRLANRTTSENIQSSLPAVPRKKVKVSQTIPTTAVAQLKSGLITLQDCTSLRTVGRYYDRLVLPSQVAAVLQSNFAMWSYLAYPTDKSIRQLSAWISHTLESAIKGAPLTPDNYESAKEFLKLVVEYCRYTKELPPLIESFLVEFLETWDGAIFQAEIFELVSFYPPRPFRVMHELLLQPLARLSAVSSVDFRIKLVKSYNALLRKWSCYHWSRLRHSYVTARSDLADEETRINWQYISTLLVEHVESLGALLLNDQPTNVIVHHCILDTIDATTLLMSSIQRCSIRLPSAELFFSLAMSGGVDIISRLCSQLCNWREIMTYHGELLREGLVYDYSHEFKAFFHEWVFAACEIFYRMKAFDATSVDGHWVSRLDNDILERISKDTLNLRWGRYQLTLKGVGDVTFHPRLLPLSQRFLQQFQDYFGIPQEELFVGAVSNNALRGSAIDAHGLNIRANYVEWLGRQGITGLPLLLFTTVRSLQTYLRGHESSFMISQTQQRVSPSTYAGNENSSGEGSEEPFATQMTQPSYSQSMAQKESTPQSMASSGFDNL